MFPDFVAEILLLYFHLLYVDLAMSTTILIFLRKKKTTRTSFVKLGIELANWRMKNCRVHIVTFARSTRYTRHTSQTH